MVNQAHPPFPRRRALLLGASRGLGLALAQALRDAGWDVTATERARSEALHALGVAVETADISARATVEALAARLAAAAPFDLLLINAGTMGPGHQDPAEATAAEIAELFGTNAIGPVAAARILGPRLRPEACVAILSSRVGSIADNQSGGVELYRASKAALNMLAKCYALSPDGLNRPVLLLHPGWVRTAMGGPEAPLDPAESASGLLDVIAAEGRMPGLRFLDYKARAIPW
jgi:NAD(P)-dependent dehydrogenase (short-subunit alcohol dehydrogenase family)